MLTNGYYTYKGSLPTYQFELSSFQDPNKPNEQIDLVSDNRFGCKIEQ